MVNEIIVYISGGAVQDIINIPEEVKVKVVDFDIENVDEEYLEKTDNGMAIIQTWYESEKHGPDCECGVCTGEDRALDRMEKGICACENMFEPDSDHDGGM